MFHNGAMKTIACLAFVCCVVGGKPASGAEKADELAEGRSVRAKRSAAELMAATVGSAGAIEWPEEDLSGRMMDGAHRFVARKIVEAVAQRERAWRDVAANQEKWADFLSAKRRRLREITGSAGARPEVRMERFGDDEAPALVAETAGYRVFQVRWPAVESVVAEGLLVLPTGPVKGRAVLLSDADQTPEQLLGLAPSAAPLRPWGLPLAEAGFQLVIPTLITRQPLETSDPSIAKSNQSEREWIHRQAFHMGRHVIGHEVQKALAAVDWLEKQAGSDARVGIAGHGEGGLVAMVASAVDPRIRSTMVSGYFAPRDAVWSEPIYRNIWSYLKDFGDAEVAAMILGC